MVQLVPKGAKVRLQNGNSMVVQGDMLGVRDSQDKFESESGDLEVCEAARYHPGFLNKEAILLLSHLGGLGFTLSVTLNFVTL